jgi:DNA-binding response OmpR family regulator
MISPAYSILIVDDEPNLRHTLALILQKANYKVDTAESVAQARQKLSAGNFDLAFLDLQMPDGDGISLLSSIRKIQPDLQVLILTAHATLDSAIEAVRLGARDYLLKPIDPNLILNRANQILGESAQSRRKQKIVGEIQELLSELNQMGGSIVDETPLDISRVPVTFDSSRYLHRGGMILDLHVRNVTLKGKTIQLSPTAFDYLNTLMKHSPDAVSYETLVIESQGYKPSIFEARDMARWRIHELRKALEFDSRQPEYIITVRGMGYRLVL